MEIIWSPSSLHRLEEIACFIAQDSPTHAVLFVNTLIESVERLKDFPLSGSLVAENPVFRQIVVQGYRVVYRQKEKVIEIVTVISPGLNTKF
ncbi:MAG: type toxin-antitoxin system RelE/ParE family toxin [Bacteriovoracaceae bacterium]|nr:type toxin-antitoxin system RelE/ParE family toxin [Bacteriovoracaceae bacterium]